MRQMSFGRQYSVGATVSSVLTCGSWRANAKLLGAVRQRPSPRSSERRRFVREPPSPVDRDSGAGFLRKCDYATGGWRWHVFLGPNAPLGGGTTLDGVRLRSSFGSPTLCAKDAIEWSSSRQEPIVCQSDLSWLASALARQRHNLRGARVSLTRRTALESRRRVVSSP
jgi:hypothetical protein